MKPLFIPLCREPFGQFASGEKTIEFRQYGPRWNEKTCIPGRPVVLSLGYGKQNRLAGTVKSFTKAPILKSRCGVLFWHYFGTDAIGPVAEIEIELHG